MPPGRGRGRRPPPPPPFPRRRDNQPQISPRLPDQPEHCSHLPTVWPLAQVLAHPHPHPLPYGVVLPRASFDFEALREPDDVSDSERPEEDQQEPAPNTGQHQAQHNEKDQQTPIPIPGTSQAQYAEEDQPAPVHKLETDQRPDDVSDSERPEEDQQEPAPNTGQHQAQHNEKDQQTPIPIPGTSQAQYAEEDQPAPVHKLETDQRCEDRETNVLKELPDTITLDKSCLTIFSPSLLQSLVSNVQDPLALKLDSALMSSSFVSSLVPTGLLIKYFVRVDKMGLFHTYPDRGGPFHTLEEAQAAIDSHHIVQRERMCMDDLSEEERAVRNTLYWYHDGTRKHSAEAYDSVMTYYPTRELLKALLDRHNEDNNLLGDRAYELEDIVRYNECFDGEDCIYSSYSHYNLTMKTKGADANKDLYFAEVICMSEDYEAYVLTCICVVKPDHNGECLVCEVEMEEMKHPIDDGYNHGRRPRFHVRSSPSRRARVRAYGADLFKKLYGVHDEDWLRAEEAMVRRKFKERLEAKLEVNRGDGGTLRSSDEILKGVRVRPQEGTRLKAATMRSRLDLKAMAAPDWDELASKDLEARRKFEVDKRVDNNTNKKEIDAWHSKLEDDDERGIRMLYRTG